MFKKFRPRRSWTKIKRRQKLSEHEKLLNSQRARAQKMESVELDLCVRGYHVYWDQWRAAIGEMLNCERERGNVADVYAMAVTKEGTVIGHLPRKISHACSFFI